jgi:YbbR domain-containing protein
MGWLVRNWQLKLGAVALATILYTGFVYSGSFTEQTFAGLPVQGNRQPDDSYLLTQQLGSVDVRYRLAADAPSRVTAESFAVNVDLSAYDMDRPGELQALAVQVRSLNDGLEVLDYTPKSVTVAIDRLAEKTVRVAVDRGVVPEGLEIGNPVLSVGEVTASGPESKLGQVYRALARIQIDESGIDVRDQVDLVAVDVDGQVVASVELTPGSVDVSVDVRTVETSRTVPVRPVIAGVPANGFDLGSVSVEPAVVTLRGQPAALAGIVEVSTQPINIAGADGNLTVDAEAVLPDGTRLSAETEPLVVSIEVRPAVVSRTFLVGVVCEGTDDASACLPQLAQAAVTVRGTAAAVDGLDPADVTPVVDVTGLEPGEHVLAAEVNLPNGIELVSISPGTVTVLIEIPPTPEPSG